MVTTLILTEYFDKYRPMAFGTAAAGAGLGNMFYPWLTRFLQVRITRAVSRKKVFFFFFFFSEIVCNALNCIEFSQREQYGHNVKSITQCQSRRDQ